MRMRVDANGGWTAEEAAALIERCAAANVEFVEQPVSRHDADGLLEVYRQATLPIAVGESCVTLRDLPHVADRCDIVNIKLMKCGGIREAIRLIAAARAHGLEVMCGCMLESAASIAGAAHLVPRFDYADLDGALLLRGDPIRDSPVRRGDIMLDPTRPGLGVRRGPPG